MARLKEGDLIVVADSEKALFLRNLTDHADPHFEVIRVEEQENPKSSEQGANRPGRMPDTGPGQRSALADTDWHALAKERFAADLADRLYRRAHGGDFERLVLVASPQVLGDLRKALHRAVTDRIVTEIPKTLTNHEMPEIERLVRDALEHADAT